MDEPLGFQGRGVEGRVYNVYKCLTAVTTRRHTSFIYRCLLLVLVVHASYCGCYAELCRHRSSADSYTSCHYGLLEGPALFARRHVPTTFSFPLPVTAQRRCEPAAILPTLPVAAAAATPLRIHHASTTCTLQHADIIHDFRRVQVTVCALLVCLYWIQWS